MLLYVDINGIGCILGIGDWLFFGVICLFVVSFCLCYFVVGGGFCDGVL